MNRDDILVLENLIEKSEELSKEMEKAYNEEDLDKFKKLKKDFLDVQKIFSKKLKK